MIYVYRFSDFERAQNGKIGTITYTFNDVEDAIRLADSKKSAGDNIVVSNQDMFNARGMICTIIDPLPYYRKEVRLLKEKGAVILDTDLFALYMSGHISVFEVLLKKFAPHLTLDDISCHVGIPLYILKSIRNGERKFHSYGMPHSDNLLIRLSEYTKIPYELLEKYI